MTNIGLTVNYGIPGQTEVSWHNTLHACVIMHPAHITVAPLAVTDAPGMPDEDTRFALYAHACAYLAENGYVQYGAGQFCLPHHEYLCEALAMDGADVVGMGVGAVSAFDGYVTRNTNNLRLYVRNAGDAEKLTAQACALDGAAQMRRFAAGRLRAVRGLDTAAFEARFGAPVPQALLESLTALGGEGLLTQTQSGFVPTARGLFAAETVQAAVLG